MSKVVFVGAGPGDPDLITIKGRDALAAADLIIYAGSLVPKEVLAWAKAGAEKVDSASLDLGDITAIYSRAIDENLDVVRLHSGDPSIYGAIQEQIDWLLERKVDIQVIPGVTAACAAAAAMRRELTMPEVSQAVIFARATGRTPVPPGQELSDLARSGATLCIYLSAAMAPQVAEVLAKNYGEDAPVLVGHRVSRSDEKMFNTSVGELEALIDAEGITSTTIIIVGHGLTERSAPSKLYDRGFSHRFRTGN